MIKIIRQLILFLLFMFLTNSCSSTLKYLTPYGGYNGKPKKIESTHHRVSYKDSMKIIDTLYTFISIYDKKGRRTVLHSLKYGEKLTKSGMYFKYDKFGNEIKVESKNNKGKAHLINNYQFNNFGQQIKREYLSYSADTLNREVITITKYFRKGRKDSIINKSTSRKEIEYMIKKYDSEWREIEYSFLNPSGKLRNKHIYEYDKLGNKITYKKYDSKNHLISFSLRKFNTYNDLISLIIYKIIDLDTIKTQEHKYLNNYDSKGNIVESKFFVNDVLKSIDKAKYAY